MSKRAAVLINLRDEQRQMIADCIARVHRMNDWEKTFIQSVCDYFSGGGFLSDAQESTLSKLWDKVTEKG